MNITVAPSRLTGTVDAPPSKSLTQRAIAAGVLAGGTTVIHNASFCSDSIAAIGIARALGAAVETENGMITVKSGEKPSGPVFINCGESGLALRMFAPVAALLSDRITITGEGSLLRRPVTMISEALARLGVNVETSGGLLPVRLSGKLRGGRAFIDGSTGSQLLTGLLMALPMAEVESRLDVASLASKPYIGLTIGLLADFGITVKNEGFRTFTIPGGQMYRARDYRVEGDWSGAAFLLVAGATGGSVTVKNLNDNSFQADRVVMRALEDAGAAISTGNAGEIKSEAAVSTGNTGEIKSGAAVSTGNTGEVKSGAAVSTGNTGEVKSGAAIMTGNAVDPTTTRNREMTMSVAGLRAFTFDATDSPDLFPPLAALAAGCHGVSRIRGIGRLRHKESDRSEAIADVLDAMGINVRFSGDEMVITGGQAHGAVVSSHNDHRIAMMAAVMAANAAGPVTITGAEAVAKSYPGFYDDLSRLGAVIS